MEKLRRSLTFLHCKYLRLSLIICLSGLCLLVISAGRSSAISSRNQKTERSPASSMPQGKIVFSALKDGNWDLWLVNSDWTNPVQLTKTPIDERSPCVSHDGDRILYSTSEGSLRLMDVNNHSDKKILVADGVYGNPVWLDDTKILYVGYVFKADKYGVKDDSSLLIFDLERESSRSNPYVLIDQTGMQDWPSMSPRGELIYSSSVQGPNQKVTQEIWKYDFRTQNGEQLTLLNANSIQPRWSPDGQEFVFASNKTGNFEIWKYYLNARKAMMLTNTDCTNKEPCWSPDGKEIVFISNRRGHNEIWRMSSGGEVLEVISPFEEKIECQYPFWFADHIEKAP
jgi:TolB protein